MEILPFEYLSKWKILYSLHILFNGLSTIILRVNVKNLVNKITKYLEPKKHQTINTYFPKFSIWPVTTNATLWHLLNRGYVMVILLLGGLGESQIGAMRRRSSCNRSWPGNSEQVCPSGPIPHRAKSSWREGKHFFSSSSYSLAAASTGMLLFIFRIWFSRTDCCSSCGR